MRLRACLWTARQRPVGQPAGRKRPALRVTFLRAACDSVSSTESDLRQWLRDQGGWVHPSLRLVDAAPCGARGVVAAATIQLTDLEQGPLVSIPQGLQFSSVYAQRLLVSLATHTSPPQLPLAAEPAATPAAAPGLQQALQQAIQPLSAAQLVAAALVHEVQQGSSSAWHPYLASLPQQPPSPWLMAPADLAATLDQLGPQAAGWTHAAAAARSEQQEAARGIRQQLYSLCTACQDEDALLWALGQVASRALTQGVGASGLVPYIDLLNHSAAARPPMLQLDDADRLVMTVVPMRGNEAVPLAAGEELCISYAGGALPAVEAFLKFGFVAPEWW